MNKVDEEQSSSEIDSAFLEQFGRHEVEHCHGADALSAFPASVVVLRCEDLPFVEHM